MILWLTRLLVEALSVSEEFEASRTIVVDTMGVVFLVPCIFSELQTIHEAVQAFPHFQRPQLALLAAQPLYFSKFKYVQCSLQVFKFEHLQTASVT
jgi:hypothetical protein